VFRLIDGAIEEDIRRWPVWFARLANALVGWTSMYCAANCGYPITSRFTTEIEQYGDTRIVAGICSLHGECEHLASKHPRDDQGRSYPDFRPEIIANLKATSEPVPIVRLTLSR
jgi:hypothetical protein